MIRGAIERAEPGRIAGWVFSEYVPLRDTVALAFAGARCVGSGTISLFRQDLKDAGLGDGFLGFNFPITLQPAETVASIVIKLPRSDFALLQTTSQVTAAPEVKAARQALALASG